nr:hypothetical protein [Tanacetum cinerariifolium]
MRTRSSSNLPGESPPNPSSSNLKRRNRRHSKQPFILEESPGQPIVGSKKKPRILFSLGRILSQNLLMNFSPSRTTNIRNEISNFQQRFDESFHEAWDRYKDLFRACPHHGFTELHQLDTFYNALNPADQDSSNSATGGNLLERRTQDVLTIIENKSKVHNSRNNSIVSQVKASDANSFSSSEIAKLTHAVNQQTSVVTTVMTTILKQFQATPPLASVKSIEEIYVTCGGAHPYYQCLATDGNTFLELRDNIQGYVLAANVNYNQAITTRSAIVLDGPFVPIPPPFINPKEDKREEETLTDQDLAEYTIKVPPPLEFADELALIIFPPGNDDLPFDIESNLKEIEYLLNHDPIKEMDSILDDSIDESNLADFNDNLVDTMPGMFTDEHALDYSSPPLYDEYDDDLFEVSLTLNMFSVDLPRSSDFLPSPEYDSFLFEDFFEIDSLPSTDNEDKVFNPGILIQEKLFKVITYVAPDKNVKKLAISHASLILEDFDPPFSLYELPFLKEVPWSKTLFSFSFENEEKVFKPRILASKGVHSSLLLELSHWGPKIFKVIKILKTPMEIFPCFYGEDIRILDVPCLHFYPL